MTRRCPGSHFSRPPHSPRSERPSVWYDSVHHLRSLFLFRLLLSFLPLQSCTYPRTRRVLTPNGDHPLRPVRGPPAQHYNSSYLGGNRNLGPPQHYCWEPRSSYPVTRLYDTTRLLLHFSSGCRVRRSPFYHRGQCLRINFLPCHWLSRTPRYHRLSIPDSVSTSLSTTPLHLSPPFWL